jgi:hypothetical protein
LAGLHYSSNCSLKWAMRLLIVFYGSTFTHTSGRVLKVADPERKLREDPLSADLRM